MVKKILLGLALLFVLFVAAIFSIDSRVYASYIEQKAVAGAGRQFINLSFKESNIEGLAFVAKESEIFFVRYLASLHLDDLVVSPVVSGIFPPSGGLDFSFRAYAGTVTGRAGGTAGGGSQLLDLHVAGLRLSEHPQVQAFGLNGGILTLDLENFVLPRIDGSLKLELKDLSKPQAGTLPLPNQWLQAMPIPAIVDINLRGSLSCDSGNCKLEELDLHSSFVNLKAEGSLGLKLDKGIEGFDLDSEVTLSQDALNQIGPFLPLISRNKIDSRTSSFKVRLTGNPKAPVAEFRSR